METGNSHIIVSVGCNCNRGRQTALARERLRQAFPDVVFTDAIVTPACGMPAGAEPYANLLAAFRVDMPEEALAARLKGMERDLGDTPELRRQGIVMMDIDLLEYAGKRCHHEDWKRPYMQSLLPLLRRLMVLLLLALMAFPAMGRHVSPPKDTDTELLGKAVEYFQGGKYHESILAFEKLQKRYKLNPRFKAYLGMSYFKEGQYEEAVEQLKEGIPELTAYAPREQAAYIYSCAESLFHLARYEEALRYFDLALPLTEGNDKGDVLFHTAFSYYIMEDCKAAIPLFEQALEIYRHHTREGDELHTARRRQIEIMLRGLQKLFPQMPDEQLSPQ